VAKRLDGKVAVITGGCSGIGLATVELFLDEGARVLVADVSDEAGKGLELRFPDRLRFAHCDVTREDDIRDAIAAAVNTFGRLDILFNNAGISGTPAGIEDMPVEKWDFAMALLLRGPMLGIKHAIAAMKAAGGGAIINTASVAGLRAGISVPAYSVAKAGVVHLSRMAAAELAQHRIRVNTICPGVIMTPLLATTMGASQQNVDSTLARVGAVAGDLQPIGRSGMPRDIAEMCLFLASDAAEFITGSEFVVDGGLFQKGPDGFAQGVGKIVQAAKATV
jgi:NAD(P)-dependent dehydrogenase (short-subunit alcohol dehydrogenase family)